MLLFANLKCPNLLMIIFEYQISTDNSLGDAGHYGDHAPFKYLPNMNSFLLKQRHLYPRTSRNWISIFLLNLVYKKSDRVPKGVNLLTARNKSTPFELTRTHSSPGQLEATYVGWGALKRNVSDRGSIESDARRLTW